MPRVPAVDLADESFTPFILSYFKNFDQIGGFITNGDSYSISRFKKFLEVFLGLCSFLVHLNRIGSDCAVLS